MNGLIDIGPWQLLLGLVFILAAGGASAVHRLGLGRDLFWGAVRTFAQLLVLGYVLVFVFKSGQSWLVLAFFTMMIFFAVRIIRGRIKERDVAVGIPIFVSMFGSYFLVSALVVGVIVGAKPWWRPEYFLPLAGMVVGNSMTALAISLERLFSDLRARRNELEMKLCLGASAREATRGIVAEAVRAGMIPSINSMMGVGVVFIPGMTAGQVLAGADPMLAVRYQIVVMLMLVGSTALGSLLVVHLIAGRCFGKGMRLVLKPK